jgi:hypothetical protein
VLREKKTGMQQKFDFWGDDEEQEKAARAVQALPFVVDNRQHRMSEVLNALLSHYQGQSFDVATA